MTRPAHAALSRVVVVVVAVAVVVGAAAPARAFDIVRQDITVDLSGAELRVSVDAIVDGGGDLPMYALAAPATARVDGVDVEVVDDPGEYRGLVQWLTLPGGDGQAVHLELTGPPRCASLVQPGTDACTYRGDERALLPLTPGAAWHLSNLFGADPFVGSITVRAPAGHVVIAGQTAGREASDGGVTFDVVVPTELLTVVSRAVVDVVSVDVDDVDAVVRGRVRVPVPSEADRPALATLAATGARAWPVYEELFGALPVDEVRYAPVSGRYPFGGMGLVATVLVGDFIADPAFGYMVEQGAAHELAHSWWGGLTSAVDPAEGGFLQEALAEWSAWRALGDVDEAVRDAGVRMNAVWYLTQIGDNDVAILDAGDDPDAYVLTTYHKGSGVLRALEEEVGSDAFAAALRALVARGPGGLSVLALDEELTRASGIDVSASLDQWLRAPGHPTLRVAVDDGAVFVDDDAGFDVSVPVRVVAADGTAREVVVATGGSVDLDDDTVLVEVDPRWTLVRTVTPARAGDVSCDGRVDAVDLIEVALRIGARIPDERRQDGGYDPLYDIDADGDVDADDVDDVAR